MLTVNQKHNTTEKDRPRLLDPHPAAQHRLLLERMGEGPASPTSGV
jgi:hypothetical protein